MVDTNPAQGMPLPLQRYWLVGKGGIKIRWNTPGDFLRCVRHLVKYFPKDPKGLCNILHTKATGGPPGHGSLEVLAHHHAIIAATALLAAQPQLGPDLWSGPMAPIGRLTGEPGRKRVFEHGAIKSRTLPLPLSFRKVSGPGHMGSVTVARILGTTVGPDENGKDTVYGWGDWLDPNVVPEVTEAKYLAQQGIAGLSLDPGGPVHVTVDPNTGIEHTTDYTMGGATLLSIPAFDGMRIFNLDADGNWNIDDPDMDMSALDPEGPDCGCMDAGKTEPGSAPAMLTMSTEYAVNTTGWHGLPLAPRESVFDNDEAVQRIQTWAGQDPNKLASAFMYRDATQPSGAIQSYRLPFGDIINGRLTLVFHAIYAAAALISGAHGGLPDVSEEDKNQLRNVISAIYPEMAKAFNDPNIRAPWDRAASPEGQHAMTEFAAADSAKMPYGDVKYADPGYQSDKKKRYPLDSEEHCRAAWSYINQADNAAKYNPAQLKAVKARIATALKKYGVDVNTEGQMSADLEYSISEDGYPLEPPTAWFQDPKLTKPTPLTVTQEGRVFGHLAAWNVCHRDVSNRSCVLAPKSRAKYEPFHLGQVYTAEGDTVRVGKIVQDTRHASINLGYSAASLHYDNTGDEVAVVRAGEDQYGIWLAGAVVPEANRKQVAKLRRSPISGDWRAVNGNLELTAALAVNVPAFPVYAMDNEQQMALVAAGVVYAEDVEPDGLDYDLDEESVDGDEEVELSQEQEDRAWELREILEREENLLQEQRGEELAQVFAAEQALTAPATPATAAPPAAPDPNVAPVDPSADPFSPTAIAARQLDARFSVISEPGGGADHPAPAPTEAVVPPVPAAPVPAPAPVPAA